jgi:hypothetical protein
MKIISQQLGHTSISITHYKYGRIIELIKNC